MRHEQQMFDLIINTAQDDERIRAVVLNGSRANPNIPRDIFQDYDIVYVVEEIDSFKQDPDWIDQFGERMIMQLPDEMGDVPPNNAAGFHYLMQFMDGNRIDLTLYPINRLEELQNDSLAVLLLDKDEVMPSLEPADDSDYLPLRPTSKQYEDCCNEFWWVCTYVAKGLWREQILYAKHMLDQVLRDQLMIMVGWHTGLKTQFSVNLGAHGKYIEEYIDEELWAMLLQTYEDADYDNTWDAMLTMCDLFRRTANEVAEQFSFTYPHNDDQRVSDHLKYVRTLSRNVEQMYS